MTRFTITLLPLVLVAMTFETTVALAQDQEARRISAEARAHAEAGRHGLSAERYLALYEHMRGAGNPRAPVALWNAGVELEAAGRHRDARDTLQRFLDDSIDLASDAAVAGYRSEALAKIADLDARLRTLSSESAQNEADTGQNGGTEAGAATEPSRETPTGSISPIGPVLIGVGSAALVISAIIGGVVLVQDDELVAMCPDGNCPESARGLAEEVERLALAADILAVAGAVVAVAGIITTIVLREPAPAVTAGCGSNGCGVVLRGKF